MAQDSAARAAAHLAGTNVQYSEPAILAQDNAQDAILAADVSSSIITGAVITGFTATLEAGKSYVYDLSLPVSSAATTTGIKFEPSFSGSGTRRFSVLGAGVSASALYSETATTGLIGPTDLPAASAVVFTTLKGSIICTTAGTLTFNFASEVNASAATVKAGATMRVVLA